MKNIIKHTIGVVVTIINLLICNTALLSLGFNSTLAYILSIIYGLVLALMIDEFLKITENKLPENKNRVLYNEYECKFISFDDNGMTESDKLSDAYLMTKDDAYKFYDTVLASSSKYIILQVWN